MSRLTSARNRLQRVCKHSVRQFGEQEGRRPDRRYTCFAIDAVLRSRSPSRLDAQSEEEVDQRRGQPGPYGHREASTPQPLTVDDDHRDPRERADGADAVADDDRSERGFVGAGEKRTAFAG